MPVLVIITDSRLSHLWNVIYPMRVTESGIVIALKFLHPTKTSFSMVVKPFGKITDSIDSLSKKI